MIQDCPTRSRAGAIAAFCLYDVGNSAFATTILAVLFNQYFAQQVAGGQDGVHLLGRNIPGPTLYAWLVSLTMLLVALSGPVLGALADAHGQRMRWLRGLTLASVAATLGLATVGPGDWIRGSFFFVAAYGAFAAAMIFYNANLPALGKPEELGRISGLAWGLGYLGGGAMLAVSLVLIARPSRFGLADTNAALRASFALAGVWWLLFALPILLRKDAPPASSAQPMGLTAGFRRAVATLRSLRRCPHFLRFLIACLLYNDGVQTVVATASIFAAVELGFAPDRLILLFLLIQGTGFVGALLAGRIADRVGDKPTILFQVAGWVVLTVWARWVGLFGDAAREFWILGALAGILLGGVQTTSRSLLARWVPIPRSAEIFGFFALADRFASVGGPLLFGAMSWATGGLRPAILSVSVFFVLGGIILARVDVNQGAKELQSGG